MATSSGIHTNTQWYIIPTHSSTHTNIDQYTIPTCSSVPYHNIQQLSIGKQLELTWEVCLLSVSSVLAAQPCTNTVNEYTLLVYVHTVMDSRAQVSKDRPTLGLEMNYTPSLTESLDV